jgi:hypothetical protein
MERQVEALSSTTSTLGRLIPGWAMFLIVFSFPSPLIRLLSACVTSINSSRYMLRNNVVFVLKRARIVPYALSRSRLLCWSHDNKVLSGGEDIFTYNHHMNPGLVLRCAKFEQFFLTRMLHCFSMQEKNTMKKAFCRFLQSWQEEIRRTVKRLAPAENQRKKEK